MSPSCFRFFIVVCFCVAIVLFSVGLRVAIVGLSSSPAAVSPPPPPPRSPPPPPPRSPHLALSYDAAEKLRAAGFSTDAEILFTSDFFPATGSTYFAVLDSGFPASVRLWRMRFVLPYQTTSILLPIELLVAVPLGTCFPTRIPGKYLTITHSGANVTVNGLKIAHPNLVVEGPIIIHGVVRAFSFGNSDSACGGRRNSSSFVDFRD